MNQNFKENEMKELMATVKWVPLVDVGIALKVN
jgi:hypothetical protein